jgi:hypothetical protein
LRDVSTPLNTAHRAGEVLAHVNRPERGVSDADPYLK